jgi:hypothetical protein
MRSLATIVALTSVFCLGYGCRQTTAHGAEGRTLTVTKPADQTVRQGEAEQISVSVTRTKFTEPVTVKITNLPAGVRVVENDRKLSGDQMTATFTLQADPTAGLVSNHAAKVTAEGPDGLAASETFLVSVKEKRS